MKFISKIGGMFAAITSLLLLAMGGALALSHTQITVGGSTTPSSVPVTGDNDGPITFMTDWDIDTVCSTSSITGQVFPGTTVEVGAIVGQIDELTFSDCLVLGSLPVIIEMDDAADVDFVVREHPDAAGDPIEVTITGINAHLHSVTPATPTPGNPWACELRAKGTVNATIYPGDANADGYVEVHQGFTINNIVALDGTNTETESPSRLSCAGQIGSGDVAEMFGDFTLDTHGAGVISHS